MKKTRTRQAVEKIKAATIERATANTYARLGNSAGAISHDATANWIEGQAQDLLALAVAPSIAHGEVIPEATADITPTQFLARDTLIEPDGPAVDASLRRIDLLTGEQHDLTGLAVDAAKAIDAKNSLEKMLAHQATMAHEMAMRFGGSALKEKDSVEAARWANASARLMAAYQQSLLTLQRIRTGGSQTVTVQHVSIGQGGQAVIGNVQAGGGNGGGSQNGE